MGTIRLYERYTGLEVVDRWRRVDGTLSDRVMQLVRPYGAYQRSSSGPPHSPLLLICHR